MCKIITDLNKCSKHTFKYRLDFLNGAYFTLNPTIILEITNIKQCRTLVCLFEVLHSEISLSGGPLSYELFDWAIM